MEIIDFPPGPSFRPFRSRRRARRATDEIFTAAASFGGLELHGRTPDQVASIVRDVVRYESNGWPWKGALASSFLQNALMTSRAVPVFPERGKTLSSADDPETYQSAWLAPEPEWRHSARIRRSESNRGKRVKLALFGAQHESCDFAYGDEFEAFAKEGLLTRLDWRLVTRSSPGRSRASTR